MKFALSPRTRSKSLFNPALLLLASLIFGLTFFSQIGQAQQTQLSLVDIITALRSKKATPEEKNKLLTEGVKQRGITFALNSDLEKELRNAGADDFLVEAIRQKSPLIKISATPQTKTEPTPAPTPRPPDAAFYQNRANANFVMGEYDSAINDYNKAVELNPKDATIYLSRGLAFFNKQSFNPAIADFDKVIELDPQESMAYFNRGAALEKTGNFEKALADYRKAVELDADNEPAKNAMLRLQAALPKSVPTAPNKIENQTKETTAQNKETNTQIKEIKPSTETFNPEEPFNAGALNNLAVRLTMPVYPSVERQKNTEGLVTVEILLDEEGKVVSAKAISGPKGLRQPAEDAVRKSKFKPATVGGRPVKSKGFINYNFKVN